MQTEHTEPENVEQVYTLFNTPPTHIYTLPKRKRYGPTVGVRTTPKVGRNTLCSCGSGKKYKKCCKT